MKARRMPYRRPPQTTGAMNMTPFIDVLLVLIVMLLLSVPIATHSLEVPLPAPGKTKFEIEAQNSVTIDGADHLFWNGQALSQDDLGAQLVAAASMAEQPLIRFEPEPLASYDRSARMIALIKDSGVTTFAFAGNEKHRTFAGR